RFYLSSSTSAYAATQGEIVTEETTELSQKGSSRFIVKGERLLLDSGLDGAVLRYGGIYGPGRTSMIRRIRDRMETLTPNAVQYTNRIHCDDAAAIVAYVMEKSSGMEIFNAVDAQAIPRDDVIAWVAKELGMAIEDYPKDLSVRKSKPHKRVISAKLRAIGYPYLYPSFREGYAPLIATL
ncbi:MAG: hypothetical protein AAB288_00845, partial [Acidobacteriota bacterium]